MIQRELEEVPSASDKASRPAEPVKIRVALSHRIEHRLAQPVQFDTHWLRLRPAPQTRAAITAYSLAVHAKGHFLNWVRDPFENHLARLDLPEPIAHLALELELLAELEPINAFDFLIEPYAVRHPFEYPEQLHKELEPYLQVGAPGARLGAWLSALDQKPAPTVEFLGELNQRVHTAVRAVAAARPGPSDLELVLARGAGSCWDLAWLLTLSLRHLGHASRIVAGYLVTLDHESDQADTLSLHAWSETYIPGAGWIGLDPSGGLFTDENYIPLASAPDPTHVLPVVGTRAAGDGTHVETLRVRRLIARPDAWPYTDTQWADMKALGGYLDRDLAEQQIDLTLGVSLSLISGAYANAPEWNTVAMGPTKRSAAEALIERFRKRFALGGLPQLGQGEWYGGDALPRWRLNCFYRADGKLLWRNPERLGWGKAHALKPRDLRDFAQAVARALGLGAGQVIAAHEDGLYALSRVRAPLREVSAAELRDPAGRRALAERLSASAGEPAGYVLPLGWDYGAGRWRSGAWVFRRGGLYLLPGDSPLGFRLPLDSLIVDEESKVEALIEASTFADLPELPEYYAEMQARLRAASGDAREAPSPGKRPPPRTALSFEIRAEQLFVFFPPVSHLEHYLQLVAAVEVTAEALALPVIIEGYEPPEDPRLPRLMLEPDPAVLRVHLPPQPSWQAQQGLLQTVYEEMPGLGLRAERIMMDGRRLPTGGGGRMILGGTRPADSPFLKRPEILRSLIAYWQRHPCLSYFFAGQSVGSGSASPRPDEGRDEALYELSIALERLPWGETTALWQADRVLRHLLADPAGDIRRAEIRIDQLYAPERASLRLGRVLLNSFETAPDPRLAALQTLLVHGLIARFARYPEGGELVRWGSALQDRFLLPRVLWEDLQHVVQDLNAAGYPFQVDWFEPVLALRFPVLGQVQLGAITLELQTAHEPWPVLAEEVAAGNVARFIDSSTERVQVSLAGMSPNRYVLVCNGYRVPLQRTGTHGEYAAGVRYKTCNPPATLHPTVFPVGSVVFDLFDTWSGRVIGGCTYFPGRPEIWGPVGTPSLSSPPDLGLGDPRRVSPLMPLMSTRPTGAGRFIPRGSGLDAISAPLIHHDEHLPYLLDLTHCS